MIKTPGNGGTGPIYEHPAKEKIDFNNPIEKIHDGNDNFNFYFESRNGDKSVIQSIYKHKPVAINPPNSEIAKIRVYYAKNYINGFKFFSKENSCVLTAGRQN